MIDFCFCFSGGGTVYHDLGNLNCTFFSSRSEYNRRKNLNLVCEAIRKVSHLNITVNSRDDIVLDETLKVKSIKINNMAMIEKFLF